MRSPSSLLRFRNIFTESRSANLAVPSYHTNAIQQLHKHSAFHITAATVNSISNMLITLFSKHSQLYQTFYNKFLTNWPDSATLGTASDYRCHWKCLLVQWTAPASPCIQSVLTFHISEQSEWLKQSRYICSWNRLASTVSEWVSE